MRHLLEKIYNKQQTTTRPVSSLFRTPLELSAAALSLDATPGRERSPLTNPSPATRRPSRFSFSPISSNYETRLTRYDTDRPGMNAFTVPSNEPPPVYTSSPTHASGPTLGPSPPYTAPARASSPAPSSHSAQQEDPYAFLTTFDTVLLIDDSGSMAGRSWRETSQALSQLLLIIIA
jgi:hypothetical protein